MDQDIGLLGREVRKSRCWASQAELVLNIEAKGSYGGVYYPYIWPGAGIVQVDPGHTQFDSAV